jgi:glyoxylase-like metal-dependent hydrolase (beta-lactamase superfamily II)
MKKVTILSMVTASLLLVGCGTDKRDNTEPAGRLMNQVTVESSANVDSNVQSTLKVKAVATDELKEELLAEIRSELVQRAALKEEIIKELLAEIKSGKITTTTTITTVKAPITVTSTPVAPSIKISSIGADKSVGEIITTAIGGATASASKDTDAGSTQDKPFDYKLTPKQVAENVWCFFGALEPPTKENAGNMANNCYIKTTDSYVVMDTGPSYQFAKQAYESMKKIADLPVSHIFISHEHDDHWLGNDFYKKAFGTQLIGPESVNTEYKEGVPTRMFNVLPKNAIKGTHIIKLDEIPKEKKSIVVGGEKFDIIPMDTKAHTGDDIFIYMPERKVLFAGDLVMNGRITSGRHGSVMGQLKALAMMQELDWKILVPGHGFITDGTAMDEAKMYFNLTKERVLKAIDEGVDATEINEVVKLIEFKDKAMYDILNAHNIGFAFDELEMLDEE